LTLPALVLADAGKQYVKYDDTPMLITSALRFRNRTHRSRIWAVRHVDLEVAPGECVGVIGRNGAGKSTMLQMLAGVTSPSEGLVRVRGRIAPLISVGVGFHPELTGRENVYVNGTILGLTRREIDQRLDAIIDFAEIEDFMDTPVKFYSSGMFVRLGFAVAIQAEPDVLLVDEVLAVGDLAFQLKCFDRMMEIRRSGAAIAVVSHNVNAVRKLCDRALVMHYGRPAFTGATPEAIALYHELLDEHRDPDEDDEDNTSDGRSVTVESLTLCDRGGTATGHVHSGDDVVVRMVTRFDAEVVDPLFGFSIVSERGVNVFSRGVAGDLTRTYAAGERIVYEVRLQLPLAMGTYRLHAGITASDMQTVLARGRPASFYVSPRLGADGGSVVELPFEVSATPVEAVEVESA
jgi:ABC-type polysaccharide/polyol phosphate transport system ATPase subunit